MTWAYHQSRFPPIDELSTEAAPDIIEVKNLDVQDKLPLKKPPKIQKKAADVDGSKATEPCIGIHLVFPPGQDHHSSYPFSIHSERTIPWNYHSIDDFFYLQSKECKKFIPVNHSSTSSLEACRPCQQIRKHERFKGIQDRLKKGIHLNTPLAFQPIGGLVTLVQRKTEEVREL